MMIVSNIDGNLLSSSLTSTKDAYIAEIQRLYAQIEEKDQDINVLIGHIRT